MTASWTHLRPAFGHAIRAAALVACTAPTACGSEGADDNSASTSASSGGPFECASGIALPTGQCITPGIPPDGCAQGFVSDDRDGCAPILPSDPCPWGLIAVPGDTTCREVADCGMETWGTIPIESDTQHVDGAYTGGDSDGTPARPWPTIADAIAAASPGAIVAVAAGTYEEDVAIVGQAVRLWGRCPKMVEILGQAALAAVVVQHADGVEVRGVAVRGPGAGLVASDAIDLHVDAVWVHDTSVHGVYVSDQLGDSRVRVVGSLVETARDVGIFAYGAEVEVEGTAVRDTRPTAQGIYGRGFNIQVNLESKKRSMGTLRSVSVERSGSEGIFVSGADVTMDGIVVRDTLGQTKQVELLNGTGVSIEHSPVGGPSTALITGSVIEGSTSLGVLVCSSTLTLERTVVRDIRAGPTLPEYLRGINAQNVCTESSDKATLTVRASLVEGPLDVGVASFGSDVLVEDTVVRGADDARVTRALHAQTEMGAVASMLVVRSLIEEVDGFGATWVGATGRVEQSVVRDVHRHPVGGVFGDGLIVHSTAGQQAVLDVVDTAIMRTERAGISAFGAIVSLTNTAITCNGLALNAEAWSAYEADLQDLGGNACGCGETTEVCAARSANVSPPDPLPTIEP